MGWLSNYSIQYPKSCTLKNSYKLVQISSFKINEYNGGSSPFVDYEIEGRVCGSSMFSLDILCIDKNNTVIGSFRVIEKVGDGRDFKFSGRKSIPEGTRRLEFDKSDYDSPSYNAPKETIPTKTESEPVRTQTPRTVVSEPTTNNLQRDTYTLTIHREDQFFVINPDFKVYINGMHKGNISNGCTGTIKLQPGTYEIKFKMNAFLSTTVRVTMNQDRRINLSINRITGRMVARVY